MDCSPTLDRAGCVHASLFKPPTEAAAFRRTVLPRPHQLLVSACEERTAETEWTKPHEAPARHHATATFPIETKRTRRVHHRRWQSAAPPRARRADMWQNQPTSTHAFGSARRAPPCVRYGGRRRRGWGPRLRQPSVPSPRYLLHALTAQAPRAHQHVENSVIGPTGIPKLSPRCLSLCVSAATLFNCPGTMSDAGRSVALRRPVGAAGPVE